MRAAPMACCPGGGCLMLGRRAVQQRPLLVSFQLQVLPSISETSGRIPGRPASKLVWALLHMTAASPATRAQRKRQLQLFAFVVQTHSHLKLGQNHNSGRHAIARGTGRTLHRKESAVTQRLHTLCADVSTGAHMHAPHMPSCAHARRSCGIAGRATEGVGP